jgi:hypothetical protein
MNYYEKYIKYKNKYNKMKKQLGGAKLKINDKAKHKTTEIIGIITKIFSENSIEYAIIKEDATDKSYTYPLSEFTKINKFKIGDIVKRSRRTIPGESIQAIGLTGIIINIEEEVPETNTFNKKVISLMYTIQFDMPNFGKVNLNLIEDDLDLVMSEPNSLYPLKLLPESEPLTPLETSSPIESLSPYFKKNNLN